MKVFIGGMKKHHQKKFVREHPDVEFTFAAYDDPDRVWYREAGKAQYVIIDQSRCSHRIADAMRATLHIPMYFTDSKNKMHMVINDLNLRGSYHQVYTAWAGSNYQLGELS